MRKLLKNILFGTVYCDVQNGNEGDDDEGLTLETLAFESLYGGQVTKPKTKLSLFSLLSQGRGRGGWGVAGTYPASIVYRSTPRLQMSQAAS